MNRRGTTLIEMMLWMACAAPLVGVAWSTAVGLLRERPGVDGTRLDLACDQLRREARGGVAVEDGVLVAGGRRWALRDGFLERDGAQRVPLEIFAVAERGTVVEVRLRQPGLPERVVELPR